MQSDSATGLLEIAGGTLTSASNGSFNAVGNVKWTGGTIAGTFNVKPGSAFALSGDAVKWIGDGGIINNSGAATWSPAGLLRGYQNSTWNNKSGSSFTVTGDGDVLSNNYGGNVFTNEAGASFIKTAGAGGDASSYLD
ncbi:MAG: hypothetical protein ABR589_04465, partial [Chthoniobacterales bacterium]